MQKGYLNPVNTRIIIISIAIQFISLFSSAQSYLGYHSSTYTGVYGVINNPTDILNHRFRGDINLVGISTNINNNVFKFRYNKRKTDDAVTFSNPITKNVKGNINMDIFGPSLVVKLSDKNAIAITSRARTMTNTNNINAHLLNLLFLDTIDLTRLQSNKLAIQNMSASSHAWTEIALTYSRQIANTDYGIWKAGISLKYLNGAAALLFNTNSLNLSYDSIIDPKDNIKKPALTDLRGNIVLSYSNIMDTFSNNFKDYLKNPGVGIDIGISYEYRDEMQVYETSYSDKTANYIWKAGASITDIGYIKYKKNK